MKKTIIMSIMTIMVIAALAGAGTFAYFNDTESSTGNVFTAGTIDIAVNGENPWVSSGDYTFNDVKPCEVKTIDLTLKNVGQNPVVVWKHIAVTSATGGIVAYELNGYGCSSEPEYVAENGVHKDNLAEVINYDLKVGSSDIFLDSDDVTLEHVQCAWMPIGQILGPNEEVIVHQSYHIVPTAGNEYQGDTITFSIDFYAEQKLGNGPTQVSHKLFLDNKDAVPDNWYFIADQTWGILDWTSATPTLLAQGLQATTAYSLITYTDPWPSAGLKVIGSGTSDGNGKLMLNALSMPASYSGKIWLVLSSDVSGDGGQMTGWNPTKYLFEANKVSIP